MFNIAYSGEPQNKIEALGVINTHNTRSRAVGDAGSDKEEKKIKIFITNEKEVETLAQYILTIQPIIPEPTQQQLIQMTP